MDIDILTESDAWADVPLGALAAGTFAETLSELGLEPDRFSISLLACDDARIAELNAEFRGKPAPTNVLSWPSEERGPERPGAMPELPGPQRGGPPEELGDIALAYETCAREAEAAGRPIEQHLAHLLCHGLLHLLGFDHETDPDAELMENLETRILARLGVPDPY